MIKFKNSKKRGKWKLRTGGKGRTIRIRSRKPGKWKVSISHGKRKPNKMRKMDKLPKMKKMSKMNKMKKMHKMARLPKLKMKHK